MFETFYGRQDSLVVELQASVQDLKRWSRRHQMTQATHLLISFKILSPRFHTFEAKMNKVKLDKSTALAIILK